MGIISGDFVTYEDIINWNKTHTTGFFRASVSGGFFSTETTTKTGYFWLRGANRTVNAYISTTTYSKGSVVVDWDGSEYGNVYISKHDDNVGNVLPVETDSHWYLISDDYTAYKASLTPAIKISFDFKSGTDAQPSDYGIAELYTVSWDEFGEEIQTLVYDRTITQQDDGDTVEFYDGSAGYYYYRLYASSRGANSRTRVDLTTNSAQVDFVPGEQIRVWDENFKELLPKYATELTPTLAQTGRLGSEDYLGGEYGGL